MQKKDVFNTENVFKFTQGNAKQEHWKRAETRIMREGKYG